MTFCLLMMGAPSCLRVWGLELPFSLPKTDLLCILLYILLEYNILNHLVLGIIIEGMPCLPYSNTYYGVGLTEIHPINVVLGRVADPNSLPDSFLISYPFYQ